MKKPTIKNAVLRKDMILDMKKPKVAIIMLLFNILLCMVAVPIVGSIAFLAEGTSSNISYRLLINMYMILVWLETIAICFLTPALTAGCISIEKERQTLEVLLTTKMTTWEIIKGKYFSSIMLVLMLIVSGLPVLSLVYIYGGINLWQMFLMILVLMATTMYLASFGVFFSTLVKNTIVSVILTYIAVGAMFAITFAVSLGGMGMVFSIENILYYEYDVDINLYWDNFIFVLYLNPIMTVFDSTAQIFGYDSELFGITINGMQDLAGDLLENMTDKNIFLRMWSLISVALQLGVSYLLLRWSAYLLKPVKKKPKKFVSNFKR